MIDYRNTNAMLAEKSMHAIRILSRCLDNDKCRRNACQMFEESFEPGLPR